MTLPTASEKSQKPQVNSMDTNCTSSNMSMNPFFSTLLSNYTSPQQQQQQQQLLTQLLLSGAATSPLLPYATNPLASALQFLLTNSALVFQQQIFPHTTSSSTSMQNTKINEPYHSVSTSSKKRKHSPVDHQLTNDLLDSNSSDTNEKSTLDDDDSAPTIASTLASLPSNHNDAGVASVSTTIDGINLEEIKNFAKAFKLRRLALGLTQTQVGQALSVTRGPAYSQSAICRFEKLDITPKSASKIKPVLEKWMQEAELKYGDRLKNGPTNLQDLVTDLNAKKRKRRTSFTPQALERLNDAFEMNTHPSGVDMSVLAQQLNYDREVIRVWFCNKRQALKNSAKKFKTTQLNEENESTSSSFIDQQLIDTTNDSKNE